MQIQRMLLYGALALVLVMIWQSWIEFQHRQSDGYDQQAELDSASRLQATEGANINLGEDVPEAPKESSSAAPEQVSEDNSERPQTGQIIQVKTDLVNAQIDTHGGDLIRVELIKHPVSVETPDQPFVLMHRDDSRLFIAQNGLIGNDRTYPNHNVDYSVTELNHILGDDDQVEVVLNWTAPDGVIYKKIFTFTRDSYRIGIDFEVDNQSASPWTGFVYGQLKQTEIEQGGSMGIIGQLPSYHGAAIYTEQEKYEKIDYEQMREGNLNVATPAGWVAMLQHYFVSSWLPADAQGYQFYSGVGGSGTNPQYRIGYKTTQPVVIPPGGQGALETALYVGPKEQVRLERQGAEGLTLTVDYGWLTPVSDPLFWLLNQINNIVNNWGWSIILLTVLIKAIFYPLSAASYKSMAKMKKLQPRLQTLKERYSDDKQKFQQEMMKLYKAEKVNPAGGCLPILVQIPVFIALYWVLLESVELRQADFMFWLKDLSLPDPYFVLPLIMGASMLAQHFLNPAPVDPIQKKIMMAMPIVFTVFFLWFPAGLVLYWVVNNLLSIAQQYYITRKYQNA